MVAYNGLLVQCIMHPIPIDNNGYFVDDVYDGEIFKKTKEIRETVEKNDSI